MVTQLDYNRLEKMIDELESLGYTVSSVRQSTLLPSTGKVYKRRFDVRDSENTWVAVIYISDQRQEAVGGVTNIAERFVSESVSEIERVLSRYSL